MGYVRAIPLPLGNVMVMAALIYFPLDFGYHLYKRLRARHADVEELSETPS